jgi:hypothetical protein
MSVTTTPRQEAKGGSEGRRRSADAGFTPEAETEASVPPRPRLFLSDSRGSQPATSSLTGAGGPAAGAVVAAGAPGVAPAVPPEVVAACSSLLMELMTQPA